MLREVCSCSASKGFGFGVGLMHLVGERTGGADVRKSCGQKKSGKYADRTDVRVIWDKQRVQAMLRKYLSYH